MNLAFVVDTTHSPYAKLRPVPVNAVQLQDVFWAPRLITLREVTLTTQYQHCERTGRIDNFRWASGTIEASHRGYYYNDSDVYKWLEGAAWVQALDVGDKNNVAHLENVIDIILTAQDEDGYLNTFSSFEKQSDRWANLKDMHELYCAGHFIQAAIAHYRVSGQDRLLDAAVRLADHIYNIFGPEEGKRLGVPGHEEIEMALVELYRTTAESRYLRLARHFLDLRGKGLIGGRIYHQDHQPFREMERIAGHAVRALYLNIGASDIYAETGDPTLLNTLERLWRHLTTRQMYITGGVGARSSGESLGEDYELSNQRAYAETCAAVANVMWNWRMLLISGEARYADLLERVLYNAALVGLSLDGQSYFYSNPLSDEGTHRRAPWFSCACCPPNIARLIASLPGYFYSLSEEGVWVHLYAEGGANLPLVNGRNVVIYQRTRYPWEGKIDLEIRGEGEFSLRLRIPGWCQRDASIRVNGNPVEDEITPGSYYNLHRCWERGDVVEVTFPMEPRFVISHPSVEENTGRMALMSGPLVYCVEGVDTGNMHPEDLYVLHDQPMESEFTPDLLGGVTVLKFHALVKPVDPVWQNYLYRPVEGSVGKVTSARQVSINAIPYYAWANRDPGLMRIWLHAVGEPIHV